MSESKCETKVKFRVSALRRIKVVRSGTVDIAKTVSGGDQKVVTIDRLHEERPLKSMANSNRGSFECVSYLRIALKVGFDNGILDSRDATLSLVAL